MSLAITSSVEPDGTLRYHCDPDVAVLVQLHRRNGTKRCPVELLYQGTSVLATDSNLRELRDIESLLKHATTRQKGVDWHAILTEVAKLLPEKAAVPWTPVVQCLDDFTVERKDYLWYPALPEGEPVSIEGDPGAGKSALLVKLFCHLTSGTRFPTLFVDRPEADFAPRTVILCTYEDDPSTTIKPRVLINGGDPKRVVISQGKKDPDTGNVVPLTFHDLDLLEDLLTTHAPAVIAFDPIQSFFGTGTNMNQATDTRPVLDAVRTLCKAHACTPLYIRHNGKSQRAKAIHAALGSIDITANMRSVLTLYKDPDNEYRRILAQTKTNGRWAPSMQLRLIGDTYDVPRDDGTFLTVEEVRVNWDGMSELSAEDLNARECLHGNDTEETNSALDQAREFLRKVLREGPVLVEDIRTQARQAGVKDSTLRRAKDKEKVRADRHDQPNVPYTKQPWVWYYPADTGMSV